MPNKQTDDGDQLRQILENLAEQVSVHMFNMTLAPELTAELIKDAEDRAYEALHVREQAARVDELDTMCGAAVSETVVTFTNKHRASRLQQLGQGEEGKEQ